MTRSPAVFRLRDGLLAPCDIDDVLSHLCQCHDSDAVADQVFFDSGHPEHRHADHHVVVDGLAREPRKGLIG